MNAYHYIFWKCIWDKKFGVSAQETIFSLLIAEAKMSKDTLTNEQVHPANCLSRAGKTPIDLFFIGYDNANPDPTWTSDKQKSCLDTVMRFYIFDVDITPKSYSLDLMDSMKLNTWIRENQKPI